MTLLHTGSTKSYSSNWENIFSGKKKSATKKKAATSKKSAKKSAGKKSAKK
jgi:hypothetical protein